MRGQALTRTQEGSGPDALIDSGVEVRGPDPDEGLTPTRA